MLCIPGVKRIGKVKTWQDAEQTAATRKNGGGFLFGVL